MKIDRTFEKGECVKEISGADFRKSGLLWWINQQLHLFGMAITWNQDTDELKAAVVKFRGFDADMNDAGYKIVSNYLRDNIDELEKDCE